ncbi:ATP-binding protein [Streptococcus suis]|uniref:ATP-binding protein n=1 Tax=Streptococcus suis TaxID=1307 RepID=UPI00041C23CF|nr:ATP-binding protein [Streptococcus suis]QBX21105.1 helicase loader [Streptococcus phage Javan553]HEM3168947.1 ATP-binding protein [Streptococcus suis 89-3576-3]
MKKMFDNNHMESMKEVLDRTCDKHDIRLVAYSLPDRVIGPFCEECTREDIQKDTERLVNESLGRSLDYSTYDVLFRDSMLSSELEGATFANFKTETQQEHDLKKFAYSQAKKYIDGMVGNTILTGAPGVGKSHLCMAMARYMNEDFKKSGNPKSILFISLADLITKIQSGWQYRESNFTEQDAVELLTRVDYLIIDDLGTETSMSGKDSEANGWTQRFLFKIFNTRSTTIVNTNHTGEELRAMYNDKLVDRILKKSTGNTYKITGIKSKRRLIDF